MSETSDEVAAQHEPADRDIPDLAARQRVLRRGCEIFRRDRRTLLQRPNGAQVMAIEEQEPSKAAEIGQGLNRVCDTSCCT